MTTRSRARENIVLDDLEKSPSKKVKITTPLRNVLSQPLNHEFATPVPPNTAAIPPVVVQVEDDDNN